MRSLGPELALHPAVRPMPARLLSRMMESKVLVVGLGGVSCEICKNLILGGVGHVTLMDHQQVPFACLSHRLP